MVLECLALAAGSDRQVPISLSAFVCSAVAVFALWATSLTWRFARQRPHAVLWAAVFVCLAAVCLTTSTVVVILAGAREKGLALGLASGAGCAAGALLAAVVRMARGDRCRMPEVGEPDEDPRGDRPKR